MAEPNIDSIQMDTMWTYHRKLAGTRSCGPDVDCDEERPRGRSTTGTFFGCGECLELHTYLHRIDVESPLGATGHAVRDFAGVGELGSVEWWHMLLP